MKVLDPLITQPSPRRSARVRAPAASEPEPGSVSPQAPSVSPLASRGSQRRFCSGVPARAMWPVHSPLCAATVSAIDPSARASSSMTRATSCMAMAEPPYSSGTLMPSRPSSASLGMSGTGKASASSQARANGSISLRAKSRTVARSRSCSSVRAKSTDGVVGSWSNAVTLSRSGV